MSFSKLQKLHIIIIGSVLCVIAIVAQYFLLIKPKQEAFKAAKARYDAAIVLGNPQAENKAIDDRNKAIAKAAQVQKNLQSEMARRMPDLSFAQREFGMLQLWNEQIKTLGPLLENYARDANVTNVNAQFNIPNPPLNPNDPVFDKDVLVFELGNVQVQGANFKSLLNNVRRWNNCRRLVMVGPLSLNGNTPNLAGTYSLTCYIFPVERGGPTIPMAGTPGQGQP